MQNQSSILLKLSPLGDMFKVKCFHSITVNLEFFILVPQLDLQRSGLLANEEQVLNVSISSCVGLILVILCEYSWNTQWIL